LRDGYPDVLEQHRRLIRGAFTKRGGEEVDEQGDGFFFVFARGYWRCR
jgi:class 3 adenylate cyclase